MSVVDMTCHELKGAIPDVLDILSRKLKFKACHVYPPDRLWGNYDEKTDKATGLVRMAYRHEVDMIVSDLTVSHSRALAVDFSFPIKSEPKGIIIRRQQPPKSIFQFLYPFDWPVWMALSCVVVFTGVVNWIYSKLSTCSGVNLQVSSAIKDEVQVHHKFGTL